MASTDELLKDYHQFAFDFQRHHHLLYTNTRAARVTRDSDTDQHRATKCSQNALIIINNAESEAEHHYLKL